MTSLTVFAECWNLVFIYYYFFNRLKLVLLQVFASLVKLFGALDEVVNFPKQALPAKEDGQRRLSYHSF